VSSFTNPKELRFVITLATGKFGSSQNNQITLPTPGSKLGFRAVADIDKAGGMMMGTLRAQIYGVSQSHMNAITTLQWNANAFLKNTVQVFAIDGTQETLVFSGNIVNAWGNYQAMPDVFLMIQAQAAYGSQIQAVNPTSYNGQIDVATAMSQLATQMGLTFENNGVNVQLSNQYLPNTLLEQAKTLAAAAGIWMYVDNGVLAIVPANQPRVKPIPIISAQTGMKGYPTFDGVGVNFDIEFNPAVIFGGSVQVVSDIPQASGIWIVTNVAHKLESEKPDGLWFSTIRGTKTGLAVAA
jgi:hypothetical protein